MTGSLRHLSSPDSPRRVRCLLAARGGCCFPASHRGGNDPLLLLYRPGSRSLRASDDSERERDGTPHVYCGCYGSIQGQGQKGPRRNYDCSCRRATPHRYKPDRSPLTAVCRQHPYYTNRTPAPRSSPTCRTGVLLFPHLAPGEETAPFYPCTVPEAVTAGHLTTWGESGTEPHSLAYISSTKRERKAKKARAAAIVVSAAAQRQALHIQAVPRQRHTPPTFLSKNGLPRRVRRLLAARERCCFPASHRGGNEPPFAPVPSRRP